jgi:hypothetical protein
LAVFKTAAFNHSATTPEGRNFFPISGLRNPAHLVAHSSARGRGEGRILGKITQDLGGAHTPAGQLYLCLPLPIPLSAQTCGHLRSVLLEVALGRVLHVAQRHMGRGVTKQLLQADDGVPSYAGLLSLGVAPGDTLRSPLVVTYVG